MARRLPSGSVARRREQVVGPLPVARRPRSPRGRRFLATIWALDLGRACLLGRAGPAAARRGRGPVRWVAGTWPRLPRVARACAGAWPWVESGLHRSWRRVSGSLGCAGRRIPSRAGSARCRRAGPPARLRPPPGGCSHRSQRARRPQHRPRRRRPERRRARRDPRRRPAARRRGRRLERRLGADPGRGRTQPRGRARGAPGPGAGRLAGAVDDLGRRTSSLETSARGASSGSASSATTRSRRRAATRASRWRCSTPMTTGSSSAASTPAPGPASTPRRSRAGGRRAALSEEEAEALGSPRARPRAGPRSPNTRSRDPSEGVTD